jgi:hypothetical protein
VSRHNEIDKDRIAKLLKETELTHQEIANIVGCSANTVKVLNKERNIRIYKEHSYKFTINGEINNA